MAKQMDHGLRDFAPSVGICEIKQPRAHLLLPFPYSLVPLLLFIVSVLYAFCRLGVFAVCNPFRWCPKSPDTDLKLEVLTPQRLFQGRNSI